MSLPNDVVDYILSFLRSDPITLHACAQSHPILCKLAERYIYADISLDDGLEGPLSKFARILAEKPEIAVYVRKLTVHLQGKMTASYLSTTASILPLLSGLTMITLQGSTSGWIPTLWHTLPEIFHHAFRHTLHLQTIKDVVIHSVVNFPLSLLNHCKNVRATLDSCTEICDNEESMEDQSYPAFKHLSLQHCCRISLQNIVAWLPTHNLRSLRFQGITGITQHQFRKNLPQLLVACSNSLTNLELVLDGGWDQIVKNPNGTIHFPFTVASLFRLEQLTIVAERNTSFWHYEHPVPAITELIHTASPTLKQIFLKFDISLGQLQHSHAVWSPFIPLVTRCSSLSITVYFSPRLVEARLPQSTILSLTIACCHGAGLMPYMDEGVFVVIPMVE